MLVIWIFLFRAHRECNKFKIKTRKLKLLRFSLINSILFIMIFFTITATIIFTLFTIYFCRYFTPGSTPKHIAGHTPFQKTVGEAMRVPKNPTVHHLKSKSCRSYHWKAREPERDGYGENTSIQTLRTNIFHFKGCQKMKQIHSSSSVRT